LPEKQATSYKLFRTFSSASLLIRSSKWVPRKLLRSCVWYL